MLDETNRVFPTAKLDKADIHYAYAGIRPLPKREKGPESAITRKHIIFKHKNEAKGLVSIIGGKLTTFRNLAEQAVDAAIKQAGLPAEKCTTRSLPLPGAVDLREATEHLTQSAVLSPECIERLLGIYGSCARDIVALQKTEFADVYIDADRTVLAAEVAFAVRNEFAVSLVDIMHRRMMIGLNSDQGLPMADKIASIAASVAGWDKVERNRQLQALHDYCSRFKP